MSEAAAIATPAFIARLDRPPEFPWTHQCQTLADFRLAGRYNASRYFLGILRDWRTSPAERRRLATRMMWDMADCLDMAEREEVSALAHSHAPDEAPAGQAVLAPPQRRRGQQTSLR